jgi:hypothetical protein
LQGFYVGNELSLKIIDYMKFLTVTKNSRRHKLSDPCVFASISNIWGFVDNRGRSKHDQASDLFFQNGFCMRAGIGFDLILEVACEL